MQKYSHTAKARPMFDDVRAAAKALAALADAHADSLEDHIAGLKNQNWKWANDLTSLREAASSMRAMFSLDQK